MVGAWQCRRPCRIRITGYTIWKAVGHKSKYVRRHVKQRKRTLSVVYGQVLSTKSCLVVVCYRQGMNVLSPDVCTNTVSAYWYIPTVRHFLQKRRPSTNHKESACRTYCRRSVHKVYRSCSCLIRSRSNALDHYSRATPGAHVEIRSMDREDVSCASKSRQGWYSRLPLNRLSLLCVLYHSTARSTRCLRSCSFLHLQVKHRN